MRKPRVAIITYGDEREHEYNVLYKKLVEPRHELAKQWVINNGFDVIECGKPARSKTSISEQVDYIRSQNPDVLIAHIPCWSLPNMVCRGVELLGIPTALVSNDSPSTHGTVGLLGSGGALNQIGYKHIRIRKEWDSEDQSDFQNKLVPFIKAAFCKGVIKGSTFGMFGGRSLGIDTGTHDSMQWRKIFGVDTEHIDQSEILRIAPMIEDERVKNFIKYLSDHSKCVKYDEEKLTPAKLDLQTRCYLATKELTAAKNVDFAAIKCMPDMTNNHVAQCLSATFLPSNFDPEGKKDSTPIACEADADAALTMFMLKNLSGGTPTWFADVSHIDMERNVIYFPNCGGMCAWYAARSDDDKENMKNIELRFANRPAGGSSQFFIAAPGEVTLARLTRKDGKYVMTAFTGKMKTPSTEELDAWIKARGIHQLPTAFIDVEIDLEELVDTFDSNHMVCVAGTYITELTHLCNLYDIELNLM